MQLVCLPQLGGEAAWGDTLPLGLGLLGSSVLGHLLTHHSWGGWLWCAIGGVVSCILFCGEDIAALMVPYAPTWSGQRR